MLVKRYFYCLSVISLFFFAINSWAWNSLGHMVVSAIAYQHLNPVTKKQVDQLIHTFNKEYPEINNMMELSVWLDAIRSQKIETFKRWHYIDVPFSDDHTELANTVTTDNASWAVKSVQRVIANPYANQYERARFLAFLVHITGDLHQPLHTTTRISAAHRQGDKGGNLFKVMLKGRHMNLHRAWDTGLGLLEGENSLRHAHAISTNLQQLYPIKMFAKESLEISPEGWEKEGMNHTLTHVYGLKEGEEISASYIQKGQKIIEKELVLAGYRLAYILNHLLDEEASTKSIIK